jgi:hypothetical protein
MNNDNKDTLKLAQLKRFELYLRDNTASRYMVAVDTGLPIQNCCRFVDMLKAINAIAVVRHGKCQITGEIVEYLSTNPTLFPKDTQLKLWQ